MDEDMPRSVTVTDERILSVLEAGDEPIRTVPDMAEDIGLSRDGLRRRLIELEKQGEAVSKTVGANAVVWWRGD